MTPDSLNLAGTRALLPVIAGPTAGGKSALAVQFCRLAAQHLRRPVEIITADAFQVYRGLDIGTAKPAADERGGVPHHLIDILDPTERFTVARWLELAEAAVADIQARGGLPVVAGGTHLFIKAFLEGLFEGPEPDPALRSELASLDPGVRRRMLEEADPGAAQRIHPADERRTIRALEVYRQTGRPISQWQAQWDQGRSRAGVRLIVLDWPADVLNRRINARVRAMIERGLLAEARGLHDSGRLGPAAAEALGYKQLVAHFRGACTFEEAVEQIKIQTRRLGKAQRTWLRRLAQTPGTLRIGAAGTPPSDWPEMVLRACLSPARETGEETQTPGGSPAAG